MFGGVLSSIITIINTFDMKCRIQFSVSRITQYGGLIKIVRNKELQFYKYLVYNSTKNRYERESVYACVRPRQLNLASTVDLFTAENL